jgi:hypothetical protein
LIERERRHPGDMDAKRHHHRRNGQGTSTARALLRGERLTSFEASLDDARRNKVDGVAGAPLQIESEMVDTAIMTAAVATTVFPHHRALEIQRLLWMMTRGMMVRKPYEMTTGKTAAAIMQINNTLLLFPGGTDTSKFSDAEIVGLFEWCLYTTLFLEDQIRSRRLLCADVGLESQIDRKL